MLIGLEDPFLFYFSLLSYFWSLMIETMLHYRIQILTSVSQLPCPGEILFMRKEIKSSSVRTLFTLWLWNRHVNSLKNSCQQVHLVMWIHLSRILPWYCSGALDTKKCLGCIQYLWEFYYLVRIKRQTAKREIFVLSWIQNWLWEVSKSRFNKGFLSVKPRAVPWLLSNLTPAACKLLKLRLKLDFRAGVLVTSILCGHVAMCHPCCIAFKILYSFIENNQKNWGNGNNLQEEIEKWWKWWTRLLNQLKLACHYMVFYVTTRNIYISQI